MLSVETFEPCCSFAIEIGFSILMFIMIDIIFIPSLVLASMWVNE